MTSNPHIVDAGDDEVNDVVEESEPVTFRH